MQDQPGSAAFRNLKLFAFGLVVLMLLVQVMALPTSLAAARAGFADFRAFYGAGVMVLRGQASRLYDYETEKQVQDAVVTPGDRALPFVNPAYAVLPFVPLAWLPYFTAYFVFLACNAAVLAWVALRFRGALDGLAALWLPLPLLLFAGYFPVGLALGQGQMSLLLLLFCAGSVFALQRGRTFTAGVLVSLALMKFQIALPVALLFLLWRQWRFCWGFVTGAAGVALLSLDVVGVAGMRAYVHSIFAISGNLAAQGQQVKFGMFPRDMPNLYGLFYAAAGGGRMAEVTTVVAGVAVLAWAVSRKPSLPLALVAALLLSYHLILHDFTLLLLPICLTLDLAMRRTLAGLTVREWPGRARLAAAVSVLLLLSPAYVAAMRYHAVYLLALPVLLLFFCYDEPTGASEIASENAVLAV